ncbi:MAG: S8 family peptidase [Microbacteriaceae bacterium]
MFARRPRLIAAVLTVLLFAVASPATADVYRSAEWWLDDYGVTTAWKTATGRGITIAVIDTGIDGSHPDLTGQVVGGADMSGRGASDGSQPLSPDKEHGTMVAALAAGHGVGNAGIKGTAPDAKLLSISVSFGDEDLSVETQVADGLEWAVDHGADIVVMSFVMNRTWWPVEWDDAFLKAEKAGVLIVAAAGNKGSGTKSVGAPAVIPGVLAVGGVTRDGRVSASASTPGSTIGVVAPSERMPGALPGGGRRMWNGSSGAAPIVAGIAALVMQAHPELDTANVVNRILQTADPVGERGNVKYGWGIINAEKAVTADVPLVDNNPLGTLMDWIPMHRYVDWETTELEIDAPPATTVDPPTVAPEDATSAALDRAWVSVIAPAIGFGGFVLSLGVMGYPRLRRAILSRRESATR